jgi:hypothetical protein
MTMHSVARVADRWLRNPFRLQEVVLVFVAIVVCCNNSSGRFFFPPFIISTRGLMLCRHVTRMGNREVLRSLARDPGGKMLLENHDVGGSVCQDVRNEVGVGGY